ncbi:MAG: hypothetical protein IJ599_02350 [Alphaproteobacteria bacterium]|nr:hypothetical protein [Alphaproteobacteria bacterium]
MFRLVLSLFFSVFFLGYTNGASASSALSGCEKDPYVVLVVAGLTENTGAKTFRDIVVRFTDVPLLSTDMQSKMHTFSDVIDGLISGDEAKENDALMALSDSYSRCLARGENDALASALIDITNCREALGERVLVKSTSEGFSYSGNLISSPYPLFFVGTVSEKEEKETAYIIELLTSDLTAEVAGKMSAKFAQKYSDSALAALRLDISSRDSEIELWNQINATWLQLALLSKKLGSKGIEYIISETPKDCKVDPLTGFPEFFKFLKNVKFEKEIIDTKKLISYFASLDVMCKSYKTIVEKGGQEIQQKREQLAANPVYKFSESILRKFRDMPDFSNLSAEFEKSLKVGKWIVHSTEKSETDNELTKLKEAFATWTPNDMGEYFRLKEELRSFRLSHDKFSEADDMLIKFLVAPYHNFLTGCERILLMKFTHFLKLQFN